MLSKKYRCGAKQSRARDANPSARFHADASHSVTKYFGDVSKVFAYRLLLLEDERRTSDQLSVASLPFALLFASNFLLHPRDTGNETTRRSGEIDRERFHQRGSWARVKPPRKMLPHKYHDSIHDGPVIRPIEINNLVHGRFVTDISARRVRSGNAVFVSLLQRVSKFFSVVGHSILLLFLCPVFTIPCSEFYRVMFVWHSTCEKTRWPPQMMCLKLHIMSTNKIKKQSFLFINQGWQFYDKRHGC